MNRAGGFGVGALLRKEAKTYLSDPVRYADVHNSSVFGGVQVFDASQREEDETVVTKADGGAMLETTCDIAMRQKVEGTGHMVAG